MYVPGQAVDPGLDEDEPKFGILILAVPLKVFPDAHGLLDEVVNILWDVGSEAFGLEDPKDLVSGDESHLGDTMAVPEDNSNLGRSEALLGQLEDLLLDIVRCELQPVGNGATVGQRRLRNALAGRVHTTHCDSVFQGIVYIYISNLEDMRLNRENKLMLEIHTTLLVKLSKGKGKGRRKFPQLLI